MIIFIGNLKLCPLFFQWMVKMRAFDYFEGFIVVIDYDCDWVKGIYLPGDWGPSA